MAQSTADGLILETGNQLAALGIGTTAYLGGRLVNLVSGTSRSAGSALDTIYSSTRPMTEVFPELEGVNLYYVQNAGRGVNTNCVSCANAAQLRLTGQDLNALASPSNGYGRFSDLLPSAPLGYGAPTSVAQITAEMLEAGSGAVGTVVINQGAGNVMHVINVTNRAGQIYYIDAQMGAIVNLQPNLTVRLGRPL